MTSDPSQPTDNSSIRAHGHYSINDSKYPIVRIANLFMLIVVFIINGLSSGRTINNASNGDLSDEKPNYLVPSGYAFSIWGLIYLFLASWGVYQILPRSYKSAAINEGIGCVFLVNAFVNCTWIFVFAYRLTALSVIIISLLLATNLVIYLRLKLHHPARSWSDALCIHTGFSLYTAWTIGATLVNLWAASTTRDPKFIDETICTIVVLGVIEIGLSVRFRDPIIVWVGAWTVLANHLKNKEVDRLAPATLTLTIILALVGLAIAVKNIVEQVRTRRQDTHSEGLQP